MLPGTRRSLTLAVSRNTPFVEALAPSIANRGLRLVEGEPEPGHHLPRPRQSLGRVTAAKDNEVVGIDDDVSPIGRTPFARAPMPQETVHVEVGEQRADHAALRRAAAAAFATRHAPRSVTITLLDRCLEPQLDQLQHVPVDNAPRYRPHKVVVRDAVEVFRKIRIDDLGVATAEQRVHFLDRVRPAALRSIAIGRGVEIRLEDRLQHQLGGGLHHAVPDRRDAEWPLAATGLRDHHPSHRQGSVRLRDEVLPDRREPLLPAGRFDHRESDPVDAWRALVGTRQLVGVAQDILATDLVVEQVEAERRLVLRLEIELPLKLPDAFRCCQAHRQSPILGFVASVPEVRALPSAGVTRPHRYYDPVPLPPAPPPKAALRERPSCWAGLPR